MDAQTSAILEFYFWFRFWPYHHSRHVILHKFAKFYPNWTTHGRKLTSCWFSIWRMSSVLDFRGQMIGSLKSSCTTSYRLSTKTIALNLLVFEKIACLHFCDRQTNRQMDRPIAFRYRERWLNNSTHKVVMLFTYNPPFAASVIHLHQIHLISSSLTLDATHWNRELCV